MHGIGGSSIEQAKRSLSVSEIKTWANYRARRGSLNVGLMVEQVVARLSSMYANKNLKGNFTPLDFSPHHDEPPISLESALKQWS